MDIGILSKFQKYLQKSILKIIKKDCLGTGFFLSIPFQNREHPLPVIITCNHILDELDISQKKKILFFSDEKYHEILIDESRIVYTNKSYDITIIEIKHSDSFDISSFLEIDDRIFNDNLLWLNRLPINLFSYSAGKYFTFSTKINLLDSENYNILYSCDISPGSSGSPIINLDCKVIGIHIGLDIRRGKIGKGILLNKIIEDLLEHESFDYSFLNKTHIINSSLLDKIGQQKMNQEKDLKKQIESNSPQRGNYEINKKIDVNKSIKLLIEKNITNFQNPKDEKEFTENLILLDYIISEKYKNKKELNFDNDYVKNNPGMKDLLLFFQKKNCKFCKNCSCENCLNCRNCKVYIDDTIDEELYFQLQKYYFNKKTFENKIKIHLNIDMNKIKLDGDKLKEILDKFTDKISDITKIPKNNLYVANIREGSISWIIFIRDVYRCSFIPNKFTQYQENELIDFITYIKDHLGQQSEINENDIPIIRSNLEHYLIPNNIFNNEYNKKRSDFGICPFPIFSFLKRHIEYTIKNERKYYYPNQRWEGYGLTVENENIFNPESDWCIVYCNLTKEDINYKIDNVKKDLLYVYENGKQIRFSLLFQCKIKISEIRDKNGRMEFINIMDKDRYLIPYRLLKEHLDD